MEIPFRTWPINLTAVVSDLLECADITVMLLEVFKSLHSTTFDYDSFFEGIKFQEHGEI